MYFRQSLLLCFGSLSCMSKNLWPTSHVPGETGRYCRILWLPIWLNLPFTKCKSPTLQMAKASPHHALRLVWYRGLQLFTNIPPHIGPPIWTKDFEFSFVSPKNIFLLLSSLGALEPFDIVLVRQQWFLDSNSIIYASFTFFSSRWMLWHFFHDIGSVMQWCLEQRAFCHASYVGKSGNI